MNLRTSIIVLISLFCVFGFYIIVKKLRTKRDSSTLIIGTAADYAPWVSINELGEYEGFDIDVAKALAQTMGKKLELKDLGSMTSLFMALEQGSIDAIIWGLSITQDRLQKVAMIHYQGAITTSYPLIFWKEIPKNVTSINDMQGKIVCVEPTSAQDVVLSKYPFITKKPTEKVDDALLNIQYGKADAAFVEPAIANKFKNKYPEIQILDVPLTPEDQVSGVGIVIKRNNSALIQEIQKAVDELKASGLITEYEKKWSIS